MKEGPYEHCKICTLNYDSETCPIDLETKKCHIAEEDEKNIKRAASLGTKLGFHPSLDELLKV